MGLIIAAPILLSVKTTLFKPLEFVLTSSLISGYGLPLAVPIPGLALSNYLIIMRGILHTRVLNVKYFDTRSHSPKGLNLDLVSENSHFIFGFKTYNFARFKTAEKTKIRTKKTIIYRILALPLLW